MKEFSRSAARWRSQFKDVIDAMERYIGMDPQQRRRQTFESRKAGAHP